MLIVITLSVMKSTKQKADALHRSRLATLNTEIKQHLLDLEDPFQRLNNDCIFELFKRLSLDDFCSMSRSCKRIKMLAENYFERKYFYKIVFLYWNYNAREIRLVPGKDYVVRFSRFTKCVSVVSLINDPEASDQLIRYLILNCNSNMKELSFKNIEFREEHVKWMKEKFENVEMLTFQECQPINFIVSLVENYKQLKSLALSVTYKQSDWNNFVQKSAILPQLKNLFFDKPLDKLKFISHITDRATNLEQFCIGFD